MKIALIQQRANQEPAQNRQATAQAIQKAAENGARIIATQELYTTPYFCRTQDPAHLDYAEPIPGDTTSELCQLAAQHEIVIVASLYEHRAPGLTHNTAVVIDADGTMLGRYRKMHIPQDPGFEEKFYFTPGDLGFHTWKTRYAQIGVLICWDQWFPEAARLTALQGAEILFYPTAIGWLADEKPTLGPAQHHAWQSVQQGHAVANACYLAAINRTGTEGPIEFWGQSFVCDQYGQLLAQAPADQDHILYADCDLSALEAHRRIWPFFRDRRPDQYHQLTQTWID